MKRILAGFAALLSVAITTPSKANIFVQLSGVEFADGGSATGSFVLNVYGYVESANITTTPGHSVDNVAIPGYSYITAGSLLPGTFDAGFAFNAAGTPMVLDLYTTEAIVAGLSGDIPLAIGSASANAITGSGEVCVQNATVCGGLSYADGRLITAGNLYVPEPASMAVLATGAAMIAGTRRRRTANARCR